MANAHVSLLTSPNRPEYGERALAGEAPPYLTRGDRRCRFSERSGLQKAGVQNPAP
jgi:hypothetical protein